MNWKELLNLFYIILSSLVLVASIVLFLWSTFKTKHIKKQVDSELENKCGELESTNESIRADLENSKKLLQLVQTIIPNAIHTAEYSGVNVNGAVKKLLAVAQIISDCAKNNISYEDNKELIDNVIEEQVKLTKEVNVKKDNK